MVCLNRPNRPFHLKFLKAALHKLYLVRSWIPWPKCELGFWSEETVLVASELESGICGTEDREKK